MTTTPTYKDFRDVKRRKPFKYWHEAILNDVIAFPLDSDRLRAARLGYSDSYINVIINSDMFQARLKERQAKLREHMDVSITHKMVEAATKSIDILLETLEAKRTQIPFDKLSDFTDKTLSRLGYGNGPTKGSVQVNVTQQVATPVNREDLARARDSLRAVENRRALESHPTVEVILPDDSEVA